MKKLQIAAWFLLSTAAFSQSNPSVPMEWRVLNAVTTDAAVNTPTASGDAYIVTNPLADVAASDGFAGQDGMVAIRDMANAGWNFFPPQDGDYGFISGETEYPHNFVLKWVGASSRWVIVGGQGMSLLPNGQSLDAASISGKIQWVTWSPLDAGSSTKSLPLADDVTFGTIVLFRNLSPTDKSVVVDGGNLISGSVEAIVKPGDTLSVASLGGNGGSANDWTTF